MIYFGQMTATLDSVNDPVSNLTLYRHAPIIGNSIDEIIEAITFTWECKELAREYYNDEKNFLKIAFFSVDSWGDRFEFLFVIAPAVTLEIIRSQQ